MQHERLHRHADITFCHEGHATGRIGNVLFSTTEITPPVTVYDAADALSEQLLREYPDGFCQLIIARHGLPMPSEERRARIAKSTRRFEGKIRALALVFQGGGMWGSSMRMVGNTMMLVIPSRAPRRMFGEVGEAVDWLADKVPDGVVRRHSSELKQLGSLLGGCPAQCRCARALAIREGADQPLTPLRKRSVPP